VDKGDRRVGVFLPRQPPPIFACFPPAKGVAYVWNSPLTNEGRIQLGAVVQEARTDRRFQTAMPGGIAVAGGYA
jgi:hypothetical protein